MKKVVIIAMALMLGSISYGQQAGGCGLGEVPLFINFTAGNDADEISWDLGEEGEEPIYFGNGSTGISIVCLELSKCYVFNISHLDGTGGTEGGSTVTLTIGSEVVNTTEGSEWGFGFGFYMPWCNNCDEGQSRIVYSAGEYAGENMFTVSNCEGDTIAEMVEGEAFFDECIVLPEIYVLTLSDTYGDTWNGGTLSIDGVVYDQPTEAPFTNQLASDIYQIGGVCTIYGCTDETASNFDPLADEDDDSCEFIFPGCTDAFASNFDSSANLNDDSCIYCDNDYVTLRLTDSYGDGWNGNTISINNNIYSIFDVNGEFTEDVTTQYEGGYSQNTDLCVDLSECIDVIYNPSGEYGPENLWVIFDSEDNILGGSSGYIGEVNGEPTFLFPESGTIGDCSVVGIGEINKSEDRGSFKVFNTMGQEISLDKLPSNVVLIRIYENGSSEKFLLED